MRKLLLVLAIFGMCVGVQAQTMQEKLYYTCKVWGFVKYYHSEVSVCNVNWDSVLLAVLPNVRSATNGTEFNDALMDMMNAAGPMALSTSYFPDTLPAELKRNRDFSWISSTTLRSDVRTILDTIKNNFRPHPGCWVQDNFGISATAGWLLFPEDSVILNINTTATFPSIDQRLLIFFKHWNIIRYFNPYNYVLDEPWDTVLYNYSVPVSATTLPEPFYLLLEKITAKLDDAHADGLTASTNFSAPPGYYKPKLILRYFGSRYVVVKSGISGIYPGDAIVSIDGKTTIEWEDSLKAYCSAGNISVFRRFMYNTMLGRKTNGTLVNMVVEDSIGTNHSFTTTCVWPNSDYNFFFSNHYYTDSISTVHWDTLACDIGYVNMSNITTGEVNTMYDALRDKSAIIFDLRYGANGTALGIAELLFPNLTGFAKFTIPDILYPGTYYWQYQTVGTFGNPNAYTGKVIILMDEKTQSHLEWSCMVLGAAPDVVKVGSQTAGADGNVTRFRFTNDIYTGFTALGVYYPNGDSTQRIGIVPDTLVTQTRLSVRRGRDNVLEKALSIAGCDVSVIDVIAKQSTSVVPNPANESITIKTNNTKSENTTVFISDVSGRVLVQQAINNNATIDISNLSPGIFFVNVKTEGGNFVTKLVKR